MRNDVRDRGVAGWMTSSLEAAGLVHSAITHNWPTFEFDTQVLPGPGHDRITVRWVRSPSAPETDDVLAQAQAAVAGRCDINGRRFVLDASTTYPLAALAAALADAWRVGHLSPTGPLKRIAVAFGTRPDNVRVDELDLDDLAFAREVCAFAGVTEHTYSQAYLNRDTSAVKQQLARTLWDYGDAIATAGGHRARRR